MKSRKVYVKVIAQFEEDGTVMPVSVIWEDGRKFKIDKITDIRRAYATGAGGTGIRYAVRIGGKSTFLFYDENKWFVEGN